MSINPLVMIDHPAPQVARILINRPDKRNAVDHDVRSGLRDAFQTVFSDATIRAVIFGGVGGHFSAGGDVPSMIGLSEQAANERMMQGHELCRIVADSGIPVITAFEGIGAGASVGLALLGDCIIVGEGSKIMFPFVRLGLTPDFAIMLTLQRRVGVSVARRILFNSLTVSGPAAVEMGLADLLAPDADVADMALRKAIDMAALPLAAFARMKQRLNRISATLDEELAREKQDQVACLLGQEFMEGFAAFKDKRAPDFHALRELKG